MNMKDHLLTALREQLESWEALLSSLSEDQFAAPLAPSEWRPKDILAHVYAWQQRSVARFEAARHERQPDYPQWLPGLDPEAEEVTDINAWLYDTYHDFPWGELLEKWRAQFQRLLELAQAFSEPELLDSGRFPWMGGYSLADVLLGTYDHHQEHYHQLVTWLQEN